MISRTHDFPIARQAKALNISRGAVYYKPRPVPAQDLKIMRQLDELHLEHPFMGARMLRDMLNRAGVSIGRRHAATLMKRLGIEAVYRRPDTSKPAPGHKIYPYLLRGLDIVRRQSFWDRERLKIRESLARLVFNIMRPADGAASGDWRLCVV